MKKYDGLFPPLVERVIHEERFAKNPDKAAKTRLHQIYGAYLQPNSNKKASALVKQLICPIRAELASPASHEPETTGNITAQVNITPANEILIQLLKLHSSTSERLPYYGDFYDFIFSHTGVAEKILDLGCGFNPFSLPFFPQKPTEYHTVDISLHTKDLLNTFFEMVQLPKYATCEDLTTFTPTVNVNLALVLKLFPVLEINNPGRAYNLTNELNTTWLVVTFPTKSLGGRKKGMTANYRTSFFVEMNKNALSNFDVAAETVIGNELVFILKRRQFFRP